MTVVRDPAAAGKVIGSGLPGGGPRWPAPVRIAVMALVLGGLAAVTGILAATIPWRQLGEDQAVVRLSIRHATAPKIACKPLTPQEMAELPPNMRRPVDCPRERWPVYVELENNGRLLYRGTHQPSGLWNDGAVSLQQPLIEPLHGGVTALEFLAFLGRQV